MILCQICFEEFDQNTYKEEFQSIVRCDHSYCKLCYQETFHCQIENFNQNDILKCPDQYCNAQPTVGEIEKIVKKEFYEKYLQFRRNKIVARDIMLIFCPSGKGCDAIIDLRQSFNQNTRNTQCKSCSYKICNICRQGYHGEENTCPSEIFPQEWTKENVGIDIIKCGRCLTYLDGDTYDVSCKVCAKRDCKICGEENNGYYHKFQQIFGYKGGELCFKIDKIQKRQLDTVQTIKTVTLLTIIFLIVLALSPIITLVELFKCWYCYDDPRSTFEICCGDCCGEDLRAKPVLSCFVLIIFYLFLFIGFCSLTAIFLVYCYPVGVVIFIIYAVIFLIKLCFAKCCLPDTTYECELLYIEAQIKVFKNLELNDLEINSLTKYKLLQQQIQEQIQYNRDNRDAPAIY